MVPPDVEDAVTAQEIEVGRVIHVIKVGTRRPGIDLVEPDHPLCGDKGPIEVAFVQLVVFSQSRGDDLFQVKSHEIVYSMWLQNATGALGVTLCCSHGTHRTYVTYGDSRNSIR